MQIQPRDLISRRQDGAQLQLCVPQVPSSDLRWRGLEMFIWLSDVTEDHGPTHIVPLSLTAGVPALPHGYLRSERPGFYEHDLSGAGPAGTVVAYSTDTFHRGTEITAPRSARFSAHVSYRHADNLWTGRHAWGDRSFHPDWKPFAEQATVRQLLLFGFPPPGHPYWTEETINQLQVRYPGLDTRRWQPQPRCSSPTLPAAPAGRSLRPAPPARWPG